MSKKILIILIIISLIYFVSNHLFETYENISLSNVKYYTKNELEEYLLSDNDNYYKQFNLIDYKVRNIKNIDEYKNIIKKSCININNKHLLNDCIKISDLKLTKINLDGFSGKKCANMKWNIGFINGNEYENGLPHTRNNIIILPLSILSNKDNLINTLIHEKIHVYQKTYIDDINIYLEKNGFTKYKLRSEVENTRANPDMDLYIYKNKNGDVMKATYKTNANTISDVNIVPINNYMYEHPFEYMAYNITKIINQ